MNQIKEQDWQDVKSFRQTIKLKFNFNIPRMCSVGFFRWGFRGYRHRGIVSLSVAPNCHSKFSESVAGLCYRGPWIRRRTWISRRRKASKRLRNLITLTHHPGKPPSGPKFAHLSLSDFAVFQVLTAFITWPFTTPMGCIRVGAWVLLGVWRL